MGTPILHPGWCGGGAAHPVGRTPVTPGSSCHLPPWITVAAARLPRPPPTIPLNLPPAASISGADDLSTPKPKDLHPTTLSTRACSAASAAGRGVGGFVAPQRWPPARPLPGYLLHRRQPVSPGIYSFSPIQLDRPAHTHPGVCGAASAPPWVEYGNCPTKSRPMGSCV
jgi:hypothetical protein